MGNNHSAHLYEAVPVIPSGSRFWLHARHLHNLGDCPYANASAVGVGSCGDKIKVDLLVKDDILEKAKCAPKGCVFTLACANAMSVLATGCILEQALMLQPESVVHELGGLPEDHFHCARLATNTLREAIAEYYRKALSR